MAENSKIEWTHHTFNPWRGCTKVSPGCDHCYANAMSGRNPAVLGKWGPDGVRAIAAESYWKMPVKWDKDAAMAGERRRVFCASLADVFEGPDTMPAAAREPVRQARVRLFELIGQTPNLDWLLLTKRPENALDFYRSGEAYKAFNSVRIETEQWPPDNVWLGTSVENQDEANKRIPLLLEAPAAVRFLSIEPLLGPVDLEQYLNFGRLGEKWPSVNWVIVGGESGAGARPMHPAWVRSLRDQCTAAGVPFFFKQWGEYESAEVGDPREGWQTIGLSGKILPLMPGKESEGEEPRAVVRKIGKHTAGRQLDGRTWDEMPEVK